MDKKKKYQPKNWREARRIRAWELSQKGWKQKDIAEALGVTEGAVSQWLKKVRREGVEALRHRKGGGPKPRLSSEQIEQLPQLLSRGAEAYGFRGEVWTRARVAAVINQHFGVQFSLSHVGRLLKQIGWSRQKPIERATQRNEQAIERWRTEKWQELEKKAEREGRTIVFIDEAGFYLLAAAVLTYAPKGQTPLLSVPLTWDHLSVIGAITPDGKLYVHMQNKAFNGETIVPFLKHLLRHIAGKLLIIWDGLPAHRGQAIKDFLRTGATERIHLERLPGYAPDLNPTEGIWQYLKYVEMKNLCCHTLDELRYELRKAIARLRHKTDIICSCIERVHLGEYL